MTTIYLSPSMQEKNIGVSGYGTEEIRMNELADIVEKKLKMYGYIVHRNNPTMTLEQIVKDSNARKPDIHFALHTNAFNGSARGCEIWVHRKGATAEKIANSVYKYIEALTPTKDRGIKEGYNRFGSNIPLYELAYTNAPAVLIETIFHDNPEDVNWYLANVEKVADGIVKGLNDFTGVKTKEDTTDYKKLYFDLLEDVQALYNKHQGV